MSQEPAPYGIVTPDTSWARCAEIFSDIPAERDHQEALKRNGRFRKLADASMPDADRLAALWEGYSDVALAFHEAWGEFTGAYAKNLRKELIQVAAVAVAWVERLDAEAEQRSS